MRIDKNDPFAADFDDRDYAGKNLYKLGLTDEPLPKLPPGNTYGFRTPSFTQQWYDRLYGPTGTRPSTSGQAASHTGQEAYRHSASDTASGTTARGNGTDNPLFGTERPTGFKPQLAKDEAFPWNPDQSAHSSRPEYTPLADASSRTTRIDAGQPPLAVPTGQEKNEPFGQTFSTPDAVGDQNTKTYTVMDFFYPIYWASVVHNGLDPQDISKDDTARKNTAYSSTPQDNPFSSSGTDTPVPPLVTSQKPIKKTLDLGGQIASLSDQAQKTPSFPEWNWDNPDCLPLDTRPVQWDRRNENRRYITPDVTRRINALLTRQNACYPVGLGHEQLSQWEGGATEYANVPYTRGQLGNNSGVTVGAGLDLGQRASVEELRQMGLPESLVIKLKPYLGLQKEAALDFLNAYPLYLSPGEIDRINEAVMYDMGKRAIRKWNALVERVRSRYPNAPYLHELNSDQQTLLFSRYYQTGRFGSHPPFLKAVLENDWPRAIAELEKLASTYRKKPATEWKGNRLRNEIQWYLKLHPQP